MQIVIFGLSLSSSWGNGHATTYRSLLKGLKQRGHSVTFYERNEPWYAENRDLPEDPDLHFYDEVPALAQECRQTLRDADLVIIGSYVRDTAELVTQCKAASCGVLAYYDIDTPVTLALLAENRCPYLDREQLPSFDVYFTFAGGPVIDRLQALGVRYATPLYCSVDPEVHAPAPVEVDTDLGYLGTWSEDREPGFRQLLLQPATAWGVGEFSVAGSNYPDTTRWPQNIRYVPHLPPQRHAQFYSSQRYSLNLTRADMRRIGYSPSVRLFEAASCGTPVISDDWPGIDEFFSPGKEILIARDGGTVLEYIRDLPEDDRAAIAGAARARVLASHTGARRAADLEESLRQVA
jgi:spore maturation protein CgeB